MREKRTKICDHCGFPFTPRPGKIEAARVFCSKTCWAAVNRPKTLVENTCQHCGAIFYRRLHSGCVYKFCSLDCAHAAKRVGYVHRGYRVVRHDGKQVFEHRLVMTQILGRGLAADEQVHHINGDTLDNRPENLVLMTQSEHMSLHMTDKIARGVIKHRGKDNPRYIHGRYARGSESSTSPPLDQHPDRS